MKVLDERLVGRRSKPFIGTVERGAIRRFVEAIGDLDPLYLDVEHARTHGYADVVAPPTFATTFRDDVADLRRGMTIPFEKVLHGEQRYRYHRPLVAGMEVQAMSEVEAVREKEGRSGTMEMLVTRQELREAASGELLVEAWSTLVIRHRREGK